MTHRGKWQTSSSRYLRNRISLRNMAWRVPILTVHPKYMTSADRVTAKGNSQSHVQAQDEAYETPGHKYNRSFEVNP